MSADVENSRSDERQRVDFRPKGNLPRLRPEYYRGHGIVLWSPTIEGRARGWLTDKFHHAWQLVLLHASARFNLICAAYVLMPDHAHLIWLGLNARGSDQRLAIEFLRKQLRPHLAPVRWQHQVHDHVLDEAERRRETFIDTAAYVLENPVHANLVHQRKDWAYMGCCVPGYPELRVHDGDYWERLWRCYNYLVQIQPT
jgi:putative transposase